MLSILWSLYLLLNFHGLQVAATATTATPAPRPTFRLWEGFEIQLPTIQDITKIRNDVDNAAADVVKFGEERLKEFENGPIGQAGKQAVEGALRFGQEKIDEFEKTGIPESIGKWVETAASDTAEFVAERAKEFEDSPLGVQSKKVVAHVGQFANDRIKEFEQTGIPRDVASWLETAGKDINNKVTEFKESEIPQEVLKWIHDHPEEMETAGWVLKNGVWIFMFANPGFIWSPILNALGWGAKGPAMGKSYLTTDYSTDSSQILN